MQCEYFTDTERGKKYPGICSQNTINCNALLLVLKVVYVAEMLESVQ